MVARSGGPHHSPRQLARDNRVSRRRCASAQAREGFAVPRRARRVSWLLVCTKRARGLTTAGRAVGKGKQDQLRGPPDAMRTRQVPFLPLDSTTGAAAGEPTAEAGGSQEDPALEEPPRRKPSPLPLARRISNLRAVAKSFSDTSRCGLSLLFPSAGIAGNPATSGKNGISTPGETDGSR